MRDALSRRTETFVVRLWSEYLQQTPPTWRGEVQHVRSRKVLRFASLSEMEDCIQEQLQCGEGGNDDRER